MLPSTPDAIRRGLLNVRANWQLVLLRIAGGVVVGMLFVAGFLPLVFLIGFGFVRTALAAGGPWELAQDGERLLEELVGGALVPLLLTLFGMAAIWTVAFLVHCYVLGGVYGVLARGDERAGAAAKPPWAAFRAYSFDAFQRDGSGLLWPFFWLLNIFFVAVGLVLLALLPLAFLVYGLARGGRELAAVGIGCLALPLLALFLVAVSLWGQLALATAARHRTGVWRSLGGALTLFGRRLGAVALAFLLMVAVSLVLSFFFVPVNLGFELGLGDRWAAYVTSQIVLGVTQWLGSAVLAAVFGAVLVALAGSRAEALP